MLGFPPNVKAQKGFLFFGCISPASSKISTDLSKEVQYSFCNVKPIPKRFRVTPIIQTAQLLFLGFLFVDPILFQKHLSMPLSPLSRRLVRYFIRFCPNSSQWIFKDDRSVNAFIRDSQAGKNQRHIKSPPVRY